MIIALQILAIVLPKFLLRYLSFKIILLIQKITMQFGGHLDKINNKTRFAINNNILII